MPRDPALSQAKAARRNARRREASQSNPLASQLVPQLPQNSHTPAGSSHIQIPSVLPQSLLNAPGISIPQVPQTPQSGSRRSRVPATPTTREQRSKRTDTRITPPELQHASDVMHEDYEPLPQPLRLFQNEIAAANVHENNLFGANPDILPAEQLPLNHNNIPPLPATPNAAPVLPLQPVHPADLEVPVAVPARIVQNARHRNARVIPARTVNPRNPEQLWCTKSRHWVRTADFGDRQTCAQCRLAGRERTARNRDVANQIVAANQLAQQLPDQIPLPVQPIVNEDHIPPGTPDDNINPATPVANQNVMDECAITPEEKARLDATRTLLMDISMETCISCNEKWFDINVEDGKCKTCRSTKNATKYTATNLMDPGLLPEQLPSLTQMEEMLIAPVHALVQLWQVRGGQHKYTGHTCNFPRDSAIAHAKVPLLPENCDVIIMRRAGMDPVTNENIYQDFRVRRHVVQQWLEFLQLNHPSFISRTVTVDRDALQQLPIDGSVHDRLRTIAVEETDVMPPDDAGPLQDNNPNDPDAPNPPLFSRGFVPNTHTGTTELDQLRAAAQLPPSIINQLHGANANADNSIILTMPTIRGTPINEHTSRAIAIDAFPSLFPTGKADIAHARPIEVTFEEWTAHLMRYKDGRFARHPRFRYWALNTIMRHAAKKAAKWYLTTHKEDRQLTVDDVRKMINDGEAERLAQRISHAGDKLPGSKPFWQKAQKDLISQIRSPECGSPHVFFTASSADIQWPDLHQHMPNHVPGAAEGAHSYRVRMKDLNENPAIAAYYFQKRWDIFFNHYIKPTFNVTDWWWRYEWQHRGSSHIHGFLWFKDAPQIDDMDTTNPDHIATFVNYWDKHVCTWHPNKGAAPAAIHPSAQLFNTLHDTKQELAEMLNRFQRHTACQPGYCERQKKETGEKFCRFGFPKECRDASAYARGANRDFAEFHSKRNDSILNSFNPGFILGWRANIDFRPVINKEAVIAYVAKYASKGEPSSSSYDKILQTAISKLKDDDAAGIAYQKMLSTFTAERDISSQETCHILFHCPLIQTSRIVRNLNVSPDHVPQMVNFDTSSVDRVGIQQHYIKRPESLENLSLLEFATHYNWTKNNYKRRGSRGALAYVVNVYPRFKPDPSDEDQYENWCYAKLLLHHPFRNPEEFLNNGIETFALAYQSLCINHNHNHPKDTLPQELAEPDEEDVDTDSESVADERENQDYAADWMREAGRRPNQEVESMINNLGQRDMDLEYDWHANAPSAESLQAASKWLTQQVKESPNDEVQVLPDADYKNLKGEQRVVFLQIMAYFKKLKLEPNNKPPTLRINVDGTAGTGKSFLIWAISQGLRNLYAEELGDKDPVVRLAPTGVSAFGIRGWTVNYGLGIPVKEGPEFLQMTGNRLQRLQTRWEAVKLLILDEKSMVGRTQMGRCDRRLRQAFPNKSDEILADIPTICFGDFAQLPPIGDFPLYSTNFSYRKHALNVEGRRVFESLTKSITLTHIFRQEGEDPEQIKFRDALLRLRNYQTTEDDYTLLSTRFWNNITEEERKAAINYLHILPTRASVAETNTKRLSELAQPVVKCKAKHNCAKARKASEDDADGLEPEILLAEGARIMVTRNLWTSKGLVNGAQGVVKKIWYAPGSDPKNDLPTVVFIQCPGYSGPNTPGWENIDPSWIPIAPVTSRWDNKADKALSRTQLPLALAWAITIHKSQGLTLNNVVIALGSKEFSSGLSYVAISRVKSLKGLVFQDHFPLSRLQRTEETPTMKMLRLDNIRRDALGFTLDNYGIDLSEYVFND